MSIEHNPDITTECMVLVPLHIAKAVAYVASAGIDAGEPGWELDTYRDAFRSSYNEFCRLCGLDPDGEAT